MISEVNKLDISGYNGLEVIWNELLLVINGLFDKKTFKEGKINNINGLYRQSKIFFDQACRNDPYTYPLDLFYSFMNLMRCCILLLDKNKGVVQQQKAHGLKFHSLNKSSIQETTIQKYVIELEKSGTFSNFQNAINNPIFDEIRECSWSNKHKNNNYGILNWLFQKFIPYAKTRNINTSKTYVKLSDVISRLKYLSDNRLKSKDILQFMNPKDDMLDCYMSIQDPDKAAVYYGIVIVHTPSRVTPNSFKDYISEHYPWFKYAYGCIEDFQNGIKYHENFIHSRTYQIFVEESTIRKFHIDIHGNKYAVKSIDIYPGQECINYVGNVALTLDQISLSYLLSFAISNLVRYHTDSWAKIVQDITSLDSIELTIILKSLFTSFPLAVLNLLSNKLGRHYIV